MANNDLTTVHRYRRLNRWFGHGSVLRRATRRKINAVALVVIIVGLFAAIAAPVLAPMDPYSTNLRNTHQPPSTEHLLGTDEIGRDILSRLLYGARVSIQVGFVAVAISHGIGIVLGLLSGFRGGIVDEVIMRFMDALIVIPPLVLALAIASVLGPSLINVMIAIGIVGIAAPARLIRGQVLAVREFDYVLAARSIGSPGTRIAFLHMLPNTLAPLIVSATLGVATAIITEASLSFLGVGIQPPAASWGAMLQAGYGYLERNLVESFAPGLSIFAVVLSVNLLGDGLREALDPRLRGTN